MRVGSKPRSILRLRVLDAWPFPLSPVAEGQGNFMVWEGSRADRMCEGTPQPVPPGGAL